MAFDFFKFLTGNSFSDVYVDSKLVNFVSNSIDTISNKKINDVYTNFNANLKELNRLNGVDKIGSCPRIDDFNKEFDNLVNAIQDIKTELNRKMQVAQEYSEGNSFHIGFDSIIGTGLTGLAVAGEGFFSGLETVVDAGVLLAGWVGLIDSQKSKDFAEKEHVKDFFAPFYETDIAKSSLIKRDSFLAGCAYIQGRAVSAGSSLFSLVVSALSGNKTSELEKVNASVKNDNHLNTDVGSSHTDSEGVSSINNKSGETVNKVKSSTGYSNNNSNHSINNSNYSNTKSESKFSSYINNSGSNNIRIDNNILANKKNISGIKEIDSSSKKVDSTFVKSPKKQSINLKTASVSSSVNRNNSDIFNSKNNSISTRTSSSNVVGSSNDSTFPNESDGVVAGEKVLSKTANKNAILDSNIIHHTGGGYSETAGFDGVERLENTNSLLDNLNESVSNATTSIDDIIKGNHNTKVPTSSFISSSPTIRGSAVVPIVSGLSAAAAVGAGSSVYIGNKNINEYKDENLNIDNWDEKIDLDISNDDDNKEDFVQDETSNNDNTNKVLFDKNDIEKLSEL